MRAAQSTLPRTRFIALHVEQVAVARLLIFLYSCNYLSAHIFLQYIILYNYTVIIFCIQGCISAGENVKP